MVRNLDVAVARAFRRRGDDRDHVRGNAPVGIAIEHGTGRLAGADAVDVGLGDVDLHLERPENPDLRRLSPLPRGRTSAAATLPPGPGDATRRRRGGQAR